MIARRHGDAAAWVDWKDTQPWLFEEYYPTPTLGGIEKPSRHETGHVRQPNYDMIAWMIACKSVMQEH